MANFFLIDHSLRKPGGHHADYTQCVAQAASQFGFDPIIGANSKLGPCPQIDDLGEVRRVFRETTYQKDSYLAGLRHLTRAKFDFAKPLPKQRVWNRAKTYLSLRAHRNRRRRFIRRFASDCEKFFESTIFSDMDHVFFTTVSELELIALAAYLSNHPRTLQVHWHLQFHYNLFEGRTPEYSDQRGTTKAMQRCFDAALSKIPYHSVYFYTTSETLADQYNRLKVGEFESLPYPVSTAFANQASANPTNSGERLPDVLPFVEKSVEEAQPKLAPIRLTCPGAIRREKGQLNYLQPLADGLWEKYLSTGRAKIVLQRARASRLELKLPESDSAESAVEYLSHPLPDEDYVDFIQNSDCGLLFYDSRAYFSRRAGILGELLSCGKPVIVPAGSWLSDQLQGQIHSHAAKLKERFGVRTVGIDELDTDRSNVPLPGGVCSFDQFRHPFCFRGTCQRGESGLVLDFDWHMPQQHGSYCRIEIEQFDDDGKSVSNQRQVIGRRREAANEKVAFRFHSEARSFEVRFRNAFQDAMSSIRKLSATFLESEQEFAIGAVGVIAADQDGLADSVAELIEHYEHYRESAKQFSVYWQRQHRPRRTVAHLLSVEQTSFRAA